MTLTFLGASGTVTGSAFLLNDDLLVDFGMFQGPLQLDRLNRAPIQFDPRKLLAVLLTHAHLDHCGRLPLLVKSGFSGTLHLTAATRDLVELSLLDAAEIAKEHARFRPDEPPLFYKDDVVRLLARSSIAAYDREFEIGPYRIVFRDAGHILGSASIVVTGRDGTEDKTVVFSGDLGNTPQDLIHPTDYVLRGDIALVETTYGDRIHDRGDPSELLTAEVTAVQRSGGTLLIPAFSLERSQELLHRFDHLKRSGAILPGTPIFLDSPMAIHATEIFRRYHDLYNPELAAHAAHDDPFGFPGLSLVPSARESKEIGDQRGTKVIIAGSGMMTGGRILHHARRWLPEKETRLLFVGYQAENTLGRRILEGERQVEILGRPVRIRASVSEITTLSAHADQPRLVEWVSRIGGLSRLFLVHGEDRGRKGLAQRLGENAGLRLEFPQLGDRVTI